VLAENIGLGKEDNDTIGLLEISRGAKDELEPVDGPCFIDKPARFYTVHLDLHENGLDGAEGERTSLRRTMDSLTAAFRSLEYRLATIQILGPSTCNWSTYGGILPESCTLVARSGLTSFKSLKNRPRSTRSGIDRSGFLPVAVTKQNRSW
jgi:hypothetical protein